MSKLYVFGIGGTGSRVLKSLTMLLAAGVKINTNEIVPVIIDPDLAAADLTRTIKLINDYVKVREHIDVSMQSTDSFFSTKINNEILPSYRIPVQNTTDVSFKEYIGLSQMEARSGNYALTSMLFSEKNLNSTMDVGFKGNPNIGSIVLNQFAFSKEFQAVVKSVDSDDRIFVISSIFGGTGAAGFPLLVKELRREKDRTENELVRTVPIGAITVLPYFKVESINETESEIDSTTFISKAKAALSYYEVNLNEVNSLYYIADNRNKTYKNSEGGETQRNNAHFVELAAALAIIDFAKEPASNFKTEIRNDKVVVEGTIYREFGIKYDAERIIFNSLHDRTNRTIKEPLTQFLLFCKYLDERMVKSYSRQPWAIDHKINDAFVRSSYFSSDLAGVKSAYIEWLEEMADNIRSFAPLDYKTPENDLYNNLILNERPRKSILGIIKENYDLFDDYLNGLQSNIASSNTKELHYFLELFSQGTKKLIKKKFNF
ncbi:MAG: hypothetical protein FWF52_09225 [Candidatus Azobacteroides sp.]|nr:hypothetical protein [Candidatus Azobacteroides sp.]